MPAASLFVTVGSGVVTLLFWWTMGVEGLVWTICGLTFILAIASGLWKEINDGARVDVGSASSQGADVAENMQALPTSRKHIENARK